MNDEANRFLDDGDIPLRAVRWATAWRLPCNEQASRVLSLRRSPDDLIDALLKPIEALIVTAKRKRTVGRLLSALLQHEPALVNFPFVGFVALAMVTVFVNSATVALEGALYFLRNVTPHCFGAGCREVKEWLAPSIAHIHAAVPSLRSHLRDSCQLSVEDLVLDAAFTFFLDHAPTRARRCSTLDWLTFVERIFTTADGDVFFWKLASALVISRSKALLEASSFAAAVDAFRHSPCHGPGVIKAAELIPWEPRLAPVVYMPATGDYYPRIPIQRSQAGDYLLVSAPTAVLSGMRHHLIDAGRQKENDAARIALEGVRYGKSPTGEPTPPVPPDVRDMCARTLASEICCSEAPSEAHTSLGASSFRTPSSAPRPALSCTINNTPIFAKRSASGVSSDAYVSAYTSPSTVGRSVSAAGTHRTASSFGLPTRGPSEL